MNPTAVYALTREGALLGARIARALGSEGPVELHVPARLADAAVEAEPGCPVRGFDTLPGLVGEIFHDRAAHVFVAACGIAVRAVAPHLFSKSLDPAVVALDQKGVHVVSLVSGHLGGANALARRVAEVTGGTPVVTTATDTAGLPAPDVLARERNLAWRDEGELRLAAADILEGRALQVHDPLGILADLDPELFPRLKSPEDWHPGEPGIWVDHRLGPPDHGDLRGAFSRCLRLYPRNLILGAGCRRGTGEGEILRAWEETLSQAGLAIRSVALVASADIKRDEAGLAGAAREIGAKTRFFPARELDQVEVPTPSERVRRQVGTESVCEAAVLLAGAELMVPKQVHGPATVAVGRLENRAQEPREKG